MRQAVLFDLDGVLLNTETLYYQATQRLLSQYDKAHDAVQHLALMGRTAHAAVTYIQDTHQVSITLKDYQEAFLKHLYELQAPITLHAGAERLIQQLLNAGFPIAIASNSTQHSFALKTAEHAAFFAQFPIIVLSDDPDCTQPKPAPDLYLLAAARVKRDPSACLVLEDSPTGIQAGLRAGMEVGSVGPIARAHANPPAHQQFDGLDDPNLLRWIFGGSIC